MGEIKNPFSFGTGDIDKDQWLRDIDNELEDFITRYGSATNKHRTALLRLAFLDLRGRIASGDMLNRTADGNYQFGSALNRDDKHMQEAYQRALGFMGLLARRQITSPTPTNEPEKKKIGSLEERYIRSLNPSGKLNTKAYWDDQTDDLRRESLTSFLNKELQEAGNYNDFEGFGTSDEYKKRLNTVLGLLNSKTANDYSLQLLGFTLNWLTKPIEETPEELPKTEELLLAELLQAYLTQKKLLEGRRAIDLALDADTYLGEDFNVGGYSYLFPYSDNPTAFMQSSSLELSNYFKNFGVNWRSLYETKEGANGVFRRNLARLFYKAPDGSYPYYDVIKKYFTPVLDGSFLLNNTQEDHERLVFLRPNSNGFEFNVRARGNPYEQLIPQLKEGGVLKLLQGNTFLKTSDLLLNELFSKPVKEPSSKPTEESKSQDTSEKMDTGDWITIIGTTAADIGSMLSANAVGYGTVASAGLGVTSTLGNSVNEFRHGNIGSGLANLGIGLTTDLIGLVPGLGAGAKGWKIGRTLTRFARPILAAMAANNYKEAGLVMNKGLKNGWGSLNAEDWALLATTLTSIGARGKSAHTRLRNVEFINRAVLKSSPRDEKGNITKYVINEQGLIDARKELRDEKRLPVNTPNKGFGKRLWNSIPPAESIKAPYYTKPFPWGSFKYDFGKSRNTLIDEWELFLNNRREASSTSDTVIEKYGGVLKALRNGGILKALAGLQFPDLNPNGNFNSEYYLNWVNLNWGNPDNLQSVLKGYKEGKADFRSKNGLPIKGGDQLKYENANGEQDFMSAYQEQLNYYNKNEGASIFGDVRAYYNALKAKNPNLTITDFITLYNSNIDKLRELAPKKLTGVANLDNTWGDYNTLFNEMYGSYSPFSENLKDTLGESTWRRIPNTFNGINDRENLRHGLLIDNDPKSKVIIDNTGHLVQPDLDESNNNGVNEENGKGRSDNEAADKEIGIKTSMERRLKNPWDPTLLTIADKTWLGLSGNKNIFGNLLNEMPQAPLRDPIDRKLAIVGWQDLIKQGLNQLADLRNIYGKLVGADSQVNLGGALEVEGKGRGIMDDKYIKDSLRQFDTAQKSWNLDNEDYLYNIKVGDDNRRAIADRARMIAQIRAAWRSGDNNILMGGLADASNWLLKRYQREQDLVDKAKEITLGTPEEWALSLLTSKLGDLANKKASELTAAEEAKVKAIKAQVLREMRLKFSERYYDMYHNPMFGTGYDSSLIAKDGTKLEIAKLKARSKDNDRYVSMIKDLRTSRRRRRR